MVGGGERGVLCFIDIGQPDVACTRLRVEPGQGETFQFSALTVKRRTFPKVRAEKLSEHHHNVYVVLLDSAAGKLRAVRAANPNRDAKKPCVYVGMSGLPPEQRFANHKCGIKAAALVKRYGIRLLPALYAHLNPMPYEAAVQMEMDLAEDLRRSGYTVAGGH